MNISAIPSWNAHGVLPPINPVAPTSFSRSPYAVSLLELITTFASSPNRSIVLDGFMRFRSDLHNLGLVQGMQWIDGSFIEDIEFIENRSPKDIDIVTFYYLPNGKTQADLLDLNSRIFVPTWTKGEYKVDAYFVDLGSNSPEYLIRYSAYWYSIWSHRRDDLWKGFLQIDLSPSSDNLAQANLSAMMNQGGCG